MRVVIHADGSAAIGSGHLVRSLALATALRQRDHEVLLAVTSILDDLRSLAERLGVPVVDRRRAPRDGTWAVFDGYHLDRSARDAAAQAGVFRLVVDDLGASFPDANVILNQNLYASPAGPTVSPTGEVLAGPTYALLRPEYRDAGPEREQPLEADRVLVTMGGADPRNATGSVVGALAPLADRSTIRVVIGAGHPDPAEVTRQATTAGMEVAPHPQTLVGHLAWADLTVSACGTTVLEAARLGRPIIGVVLADNQELVARALGRERLGTVVGRYPDINPDELRRAVQLLTTDPLERRAIAERGPSLVDGRGAERVARAMETGPLFVRPATLDDAELLFAWRNDPITRAASFNPEPIDRADHLTWLLAELRNDRRRVWIGAAGGVPIGTIRFAIEGSAATASVTVAPEQRGGGFGARMVAAGCARLAEERSVTAIDAWIRTENAASRTIFNAVGFRVAETRDDRHRYRLELTAVR